MTTVRRALVIAGALVALFANVAPAQGRDIRIRDFTSLISVHNDGTIGVMEEIVVGFTGQWNGIVRDLSLHHNTAQGRPTKLDVVVEGVTDGSGMPLRVEQTNKGDGWTRSLKIWVPNALNADRTVVIRYRVRNAIRFFYKSSSVGELDELYWNATGNSWTMTIDHAQARVVLPDEIIPTKVAVYTGASGATNSDATIQKDGNEVGFTTTRPLRPYEGLTIGVGWPAGHIANRPSEAKQRLMDIVRYLPAIIPVLVFFFAYAKWKTKGRDPEELSYVVHYEPIAGQSPAELGTLVDNSADMDDITATLVDLAVRGYIHITELNEEHLFGLTKSTDYQFDILKPPSEWKTLKAHEQEYLTGLFEAAPDNGMSVKVSELRNRFYKTLPRIRNAIYDSLVESGYYRERPDTTKAKWIGLAVFSAAVLGGLSVLSLSRAWSIVAPPAMIFAAASSVVILFFFAFIMPARTEQGARAREATLGFKEFLSRVESERYKQMITSPEMFEKYLAYAMAFDVADEWAKAFENIYREPPQWYSGGSGQFNVIGFSNSIGSMTSAAASSMSSSPSSSGSGGGGSSGGGSGGGGGSGF
ncbi:MAG TPA: DUF2207 domain-containing protein [Gemmatimonadaceae bacterium]|jgi:hypothetical protein